MLKKTNHLIGSAVCGILTLFGIIASILSLVGGQFIVDDMLCLVISVLIGYYAFLGYQKPHGNLLKYIMLIYATCDLFALYSSLENGQNWQIVLRAILIGLLCFVAGRLNKVNHNIFILIISTICLLTVNVSMIIDGQATLGVVSWLIIWADICVAYFFRYKEHKEAGLMDAPKN